eukprot:scaffold30_cov416-Prasinococcus_capsulatus_cf.AAC.30
MPHLGPPKAQPHSREGRSAAPRRRPRCRCRPMLSHIAPNRHNVGAVPALRPPRVDSAANGHVRMASALRRSQAGMVRQEDAQRA